MIATLAVSAWILGLLTAAFLFICVVLILTILIQKPQGGGLGGAFGAGGGGSSGQTAFGARTGDALTIATIVMFVVFLVTAVGLNFASKPGAFEGGNATVTSAEDPQPAAEPGAGATDDDETLPDTDAETGSDTGVDTDVDAGTEADPVPTDGEDDTTDGEG